MGKKIIRLTESDLIRVIKKVLNEQSQNLPTKFEDLDKYQFKKINDNEMFKEVNGEYFHLKKDGTFWTAGKGNKKGNWKFGLTQGSPLPGISLTYTGDRNVPRKTLPKT